MVDSANPEPPTCNDSAPGWEIAAVAIGSAIAAGALAYTILKWRGGASRASGRKATQSMYYTDTAILEGGSGETYSGPGVITTNVLVAGHADGPRDDREHLVPSSVNKS